MLKFSKINKLKNIIYSNKKIVENYFFITILKVLNSFFYLIIYPFIIRKLGAEGYGTYIYAISIVAFFMSFITFGFDLHGAKLIAQNFNDKISKANTLSCIFTAKSYLQVLAFIVFTTLILSITALRNNWIILLICFTQTSNNIFFPQWYFQGVQRMKIVTFIQIGVKVLMLPFIFAFIQNPGDLWIFALINATGNILGALIAALIIKCKDNLTIHLVPLKDLVVWYKDAFPFFLNSFIGALKEQLIVIIIGAFLGMEEVAVYDLGYKIMSIPRLILLSINDALFPHIINNFNKKIIRKIITVETIIGILVVLLVLLFGKSIVIFLGGVAMLQAYPIAVILSFLVLTWLVVGAYIHFVFIPQNRYYFVTKKQIVSLFSFLVYCSMGLLFQQSVFVLAISISLSGLTEIVYCEYLIKTRNLL